MLQGRSHHGGNGGRVPRAPHYDPRSQFCGCLCLREPILVLSTQSAAWPDLKAATAAAFHSQWMKTDLISHTQQSYFFLHAGCKLHSGDWLIDWLFFLNFILFYFSCYLKYCIRIEQFGCRAANVFNKVEFSCSLNFDTARRPCLPPSPGSVWPRSSIGKSFFSASQSV